MICLQDIPGSCPPGTYRALGDGITCKLCPQGTWSRTLSLPGADLCEPCPAGIVCAVDGSFDLAAASPCPEGYVCSIGTNSVTQFETLCPAGYFCDFGTTPASQYDYLCEPGFGCTAGTGYTQRKRLRCEVGYFCPAGSVSDRPEATRCPVGTTSEPFSETVHDCVRDLENFDKICTLSPMYTESFDECLLGFKCSKISDTFEEYSLCLQNGLIDTNRIMDDILTNEATVNDNFFLAEAMSLVRVSCDWRLIPPEMQYNDHFQFVYYQFNNTQSTKVHEVRPGMAGTWFGKTEIPKHEILIFHLLPLRDTFIRFDIDILHGLFIENKNYTAFRDTVRFEVVKPSRAAVNADRPHQFYILMPKSGQVRPPLNVKPVVSDIYIDETSGGQAVRYINELQPILDFTGKDSKFPLIPQAFNDDGDIAGVSVSDSAFWPVVDQIEHSFYVLPYLPYFSACRGFDSHIPLFMLLESQEHCNLVPYNRTSWVNQWDPFNTPTAVEIDGAMDSCSQLIQCVYEEEIDKVSPVPRWFEQQEGFALFHLTRDAHPYDHYAEAYSGENTDDGLRFFTSMIDTSRAVPVYIAPGDFAIDDRTKVSGVPRTFHMTIDYYQRSPAEKRIVSATVVFENYTPKEQDGELIRDYNILFDFRALDYLSLLNGFSFDPEIYIVLFLVVGCGCVAFFAVFWAFQRIFTRISNPPNLSLTKYLYMIVRPTWSFWLALIPLLISFGAIQLLFISLPYPVFGEVNEQFVDFGKASQWSQSKTISLAQLIGLDASAFVQRGRVALSILILALYMCYVTACCMIPKKVEIINISLYDRYSQIDEVKQDNLWRRALWWKRNQFLMSILIAVLADLVVLEYSYSGDESAFPPLTTENVV